LISFLFGSCFPVSCTSLSSPGLLSSSFAASSGSPIFTPVPLSSSLFSSASSSESLPQIYRQKNTKLPYFGRKETATSSTQAKSAIYAGNSSWQTLLSSWHIWHQTKLYKSAAFTSCNLLSNNHQFLSSSMYVRMHAPPLHTHTHIYSIDPLFLCMAFGYEKSYNTIKTWLCKTISSHIPETSWQKVPLKNTVFTIPFLYRNHQYLFHVGNLNIH
jgi:hypothetical protein